MNEFRLRFFSANLQIATGYILVLVCAYHFDEIFLIMAVHFLYFQEPFRVLRCLVFLIYFWLVW